MINKKIQNYIFGLALAISNPYRVSAAAADVSDLGVNLTIQSVFAIIVGLVCWFSRFALVLIVAMVIFYGIKFMTSQGNPEQYNKAKGGLTWAIVGIAVILGTYTIIATVANAIGADYTLIVPLNCSVN